MYSIPANIEGANLLLPDSSHKCRITGCIHGYRPDSPGASFFLEADLVGVASPVVDCLRNCARLFSLLGVGRDGSARACDPGELPCGSAFEFGVRVRLADAAGLGRILSR